MKKIYLILLFAPLLGIAQPRYAEVKIEQFVRPHHETASHSVETTVLARAAHSYDWTAAYRHDTLVKKFRDTENAKLKELLRANEAGKKYLAEAAEAEKNKDVPVLGTDVHDR